MSVFLYKKTQNCGGLVIIFIFVVRIGASKALNLCVVRGENPSVI